MLEMTVALFIVGMLLSMVIANGIDRVNKAKLEKTVNEMMVIAQASLDYYNSQGTWPGTPGDLVPTYMNAAVILSPFRNSYLINYQSNGQSNTVIVSTTVPTGLAKSYYQGILLQVLPGFPMDTVSVTQQLPNEFSGRLEYEKKYRYLQ